MPAVAAALAGVAFVLLRLAVVAKWNITRFVMAGTDWVDRAKAPAGLYVFRGSGYDGQFYYRLALDPSDLGRAAFGIGIDAAFRFQRIGFPVLSWVASGGDRALVPYSLVAVNLAALVLLALLGGMIARDAGRHAAWGLLVAGYWGFLFSIGRDLPEVVASCALVGGLVAMRRRHALLAGLLFGAAVLTLETTLDVVVAMGLVCIAQLLLRRRRPGWTDAAWIVPAVAFVGWQLTVRAVTGALPARSDSGDNLGLPFVNMVGAVVHYLGELPSKTADIWLLEFAVLAFVTLYAGFSLLWSRVPVWEKGAWAMAFLVALSLAHGIWYGQADFRGFEDVYLLSSIVLLGSRHRLWVPAALVALVWVLTFAHRVVSL